MHVVVEKYEYIYFPTFEIQTMLSLLFTSTVYFYVFNITGREIGNQRSGRRTIGCRPTWGTGRNNRVGPIHPNNCIPHGWRSPDRTSHVYLC